MRIPLDIETFDRGLAIQIVGSKSLAAGATAEVPGGARLQFQGALERKALDIPTVLQFVIDISKDVEVGLLSAWLYDLATSKRAERIVIRRRGITELTEDGIRQVIEEEIESQR